MTDKKINYLGRLIPIKNFRAYVYDVEGRNKLVGSWNEFEASINTNLWFESKEAAEEALKIQSNPGMKKQKKEKKEKIDKTQEHDPLLSQTLSIDELPQIDHGQNSFDPLGFEVTDNS